jgi:hypothetical protein
VAWFAAAGLLVAAVLAAGVVALSALTRWWVLFALFGVFPLLMMVGGMTMMMAMRGGFGGFCAAASRRGFCGVRWCAAPKLGRDARQVV